MGAAGPPPLRQGRRSGHWEAECGEQRGTTWGWGGVRSWGPSSTTTWTSFFPLPIAHRLPVLALTQGPGVQALMPAPPHKRRVFIFRADCCPLRICLLEGSACDCTPCPESKRDRRQPLAGDVSKYEPGTKSQVPRPPLPWETQPGFSRLLGGRGLVGIGRIRRQPAETAISPGNIACTPPWPSSLVKGRERIALHPESLINCPQPLAVGTGKPLLKCARIKNIQMESFSSPLLNPLKPGMLVKNSLAVVWILQNPMAGRKMKEPFEAVLSGHPGGVGCEGPGEGVFRCF